MSARSTISLGTYGPLWLRSLSVSRSQIGSHMHIIGVSGSGKSRYLAHLYLALLRAGLSATLIDPHGDLAKLVLSHLVADGLYNDPSSFERVLYLDLPAAQRAERFLPFNVLSHSVFPHAAASKVLEAMHRAWPALAGGNAATFDTLVLNGVKVLLTNRLPLVRLYNLLTDKGYRDRLLAQETDPDVVSIFRNWYDKLPPRDQADQAGATLRRVNLLTFDPVLKYSLGQSETLLDYRALIDANRSLIINLALDNPEARRLLGCLLTVSAEQGAKSRVELAADQRLSSHHLILDEFSEFTAQSEEAMTTMLSQTRKFGLFLVMAHQTWSQASERLRGAVQNVGIEVAFRLGRADAEHSAMLLGHVDPLTVKHEVKDEHAVDRTHPVFYSLPEQWEGWVEELQDLPARRAYVALHNTKRHWWHLHYKPRRVVSVKTPALPDPRVAKERVTDVEETYLRRYFRSQRVIEAELASTLTYDQSAIPIRIEPISATSIDVAASRDPQPSSGQPSSTPQSVVIFDRSVHHMSRRKPPKQRKKKQA